MRALSLIAAIVLTAVSMQGQSPPAAPLRLVAADGQRTIPTLLSGDTEFVAIEDLASMFRVVVRDDALAKALTVNYQGRSVVLSQDQALASIGGRLVSLPAPPARINGRWHVPVEFIGRALSAIYDVPLELRKSSRLVILGPMRVPRVVVRHDVAGTQARVTVDIFPRTPHTIVQEATRLLVRLDADLLDMSIPPFQPQGLVQGIRIDGTSIAVDLGPRFESFRSSDAPLDPDGTRVTVDLFATPEQTAAPGASPGGPVPTSPEPPPLLPTVRTIVIDPGHGGDEEGAKGAKGTLEKAITLSVARRLKGALETRLGARVLLTRDNDRTLPLDERAAFANNNKADLFISLHANASLRRNAAGAEVFYLSLDGANEEVRRVAESEGAAMPVFGGGTREIDVILWEMAQARHLDQSATLARTVETALRQRVPMSPNAIQQAPIRVLVGANMPAVLVELGYVTNAEQEGQLASGEFQGRLAQALADAVAGYFTGRMPAPPTSAVVPAATGPRR